MILVIVDLNDLAKGWGDVAISEHIPEDRVARLSGIADAFAIRQIYYGTRFEFMFFDIGKAWPEICPAASSGFEMNVLTGFERLYPSHFGVHVEDRQRNGESVSDAFRFTPEPFDQFIIDAARGVDNKNDASGFRRFRHRQV